MTPAAPRLRQKPLHLFLLLALSGFLLLVDYFTGPFIEFEATFVFAVGAAVWFVGRDWGLILAVILPVCRLSYAMTQGPPWTLTQATINAVIRIAVLAVFAFMAARVRSALALAREVEVLRGILPVCSDCRKIMDADGEWRSLESYVSTRSQATVAQTMCAECAKSHYGETFDRR